ncbi:MAG: TIGR03546 family protein [Planctomycetota bacterium]
MIEWTPSLMLWVFEKIRIVCTGLASKDSPRQMAAGIACGVVLGFLPKGNLLAIAVTTLLLATRMSLATGMLCAFVISLIAPLCDPFTHRIGEWALTNRAALPFWRSVAELPLVAWTSFNNTVVMGSLITGSVLVYPVYCLSLPWMERLRQRRERAARKDDDAAGALTGELLPLSENRPRERDAAGEWAAEQAVRAVAVDRREAGCQRSRA